MRTEAKFFSFLFSLNSPRRVQMRALGRQFTLGTFILAFVGLVISTVAVTMYLSVFGFTKRPVTIEERARLA